MVSFDELIGRLGKLSELPRTVAIDGFTPLEPMQNLSPWIGRASLFVKRDDLNGLAFGGNKLRQLEYYFGDAVAQGADTMLITGAVQSNFARLTAALCCKLGMECHIQLEDRVPHVSEHYRRSGNVLLKRILGAHLHPFPEGENEQAADESVAAIAADLRDQGRNPYVIPLAPGHTPLGALGYVRAAAEILAQIELQQLTVDEIVVPSGSGSTHAGLLFGLRALESDLPVIGSCVRRPKEAQFPRILARCRDLSELLELPVNVTDDDIQLTDDFLAPGYGQMNAAAWEATQEAALKEALFLDPTYTSKTMAAFLERARQSAKDQTLIFVHTGGAPGIFAYLDEYDKVLDPMQG